MMKNLKVKLLTGRSGVDGSHLPGDNLELPIAEAIVLIATNQAEAVNKKAYEAALEVDRKKQLEDEETAVKINAIAHKEQLTSEINALYEEVVLKEAELNGVVLDGEQILEMVEELKKRILPVGGDK